MASTHRAVTGRDSRTNRFVASLLQTTVLESLSSAGFLRSSEHATLLLTELLERYLLLLASTSAQHAQHANRTRCTPWDVQRALEELGVDVEELRDFGEAEERFKPRSKVTNEVEERADGVKGAAAVLRPLQKIGRSEEAPLAEAHYVRVPDEDLELYRSLQELEDQSWLRPPSDDEADADEIDSDDDEADARSDSPPTSRSAGSAPGSPNGKRRKLSAAAADDDALVPPFLPPLAPVEVIARGEASSLLRPVEDAEHARAIKEEAERTAAQEPIREEQPAESETTHEAAKEAAEDSANNKHSQADPWRTLVPYERSTLAETQSIDALPAAGPSEEPRTPATSSLPAFIADYRALAEENAQLGPILLTPQGNAYAQLAAKRRLLAATLCDASRYSPSASLFGAISAYPSSIPFSPSPSLLITLPKKEAAPVFTPTRPHGRPAALIPPSGSLAPALGYRHPSQLVNAARFVTPSAPLLRQLTRTEDPPPVLDEHHAERVFHGIPVGKDLLKPQNSALAPAVQALIRRGIREEAVRNGTAGDGINGGLGEDGITAGLPRAEEREAHRPTQGTLVHTWDWTTRDWSDTQLPGKTMR